MAFVVLAMILLIISAIANERQKVSDREYDEHLATLEAEQCKN